MSYEALVAELTSLRAEAKAECSPCRSVANKSVCFVQPCGPHCAYPYTDERLPACENCATKASARKALAGPAHEMAACCEVLVEAQRYEHSMFCGEHPAQQSPQCRAWSERLTVLAVAMGVEVTA
jgi:hypothetical protein